MSRTLTTMLLTVSVAACTPAALTTTLQQGQLLCSVAGPAAPFVVPVIDAATKAPVSVVGKSAEAVAGICAVVKGIPVAPPADVSKVSAAPVAVVMPPANLTAPK